MTATLVGFDQSLNRAAASLGAPPTTTFFKVTMPLIMPGVISGALFAFVTSFDEVVVVLFVAAHDQQTIPRQMWNGIREQISPTILAVATILVAISIALLTVLELLRRRSERLRGLSPGLTPAHSASARRRFRPISSPCPSPPRPTSSPARPATCCTPWRRSPRAAACAAAAATPSLLTNRRGAIDRTLASAFASVILMTAAIFFPFLELSVAGLHKNASLLDAALAFSHGLMAPLSIATTLLIIVLPVIRASALAYTLLPLRFGRPPAPGAARAFRIAEHLKPWAMSEVFLIGVVVALVKVGGMASIDLGPAFWAMAGLVLLVVLECSSLNEWSIWQILERSAPSPDRPRRRA